jgi:serine/threonine-protein kinase
MSDPFGSWQLESVIAVGGLGEIWRATRGAETAALKRLHTHLARNEEMIAQFELEQQLTIALPRHPNVVHAIEVGKVEQRRYVALEIAPGADLRRVLAPPVTKAEPSPRPALLPRARILAIARAACEAAAHLHRFGWIHGDINPSNLIVDDDDRTTLVDLGVARRAGEAGAVRGTHAYMAPEQVRGEAWTPATDVFALAVVVWELAANARLFHRGPPWLTMAAVVEAPVPSTGDPALDAALAPALEKDPSRRLDSPRALVTRLG